MKSKAAILWATGEPWSVEEIELDEPRAKEVLVRIEAAGMCHSDNHVRQGDGYAALPAIGGHEGAGVIEAAVGKPIDKPIAVWLMAMFPRKVEKK
jgi:S-(hydroxymethyl)glutathione dehydrogenase/alcohol dehydrogenase